jgi:hypothetical protein
MTETIIELQPGDHGVREMNILPRNGKEEQHFFRIEDGKFVEVPQTADATTSPTSNANANHEPRVVKWLKEQEAKLFKDAQQKPPAEHSALVPFTFSISNVASALGIAESSARYVIDEILRKKRGWVNKSGHGLYTWVGDLHKAAGLETPPET